MSGADARPCEPAPCPGEGGWTNRLFWTVFGIVAGWRVLVASRLAICYDEGYYHYWSAYPQLSYLDHPPLVAWAMALARSWFGDSLWTVRFWPLVGGTVFVMVARALARRMYDSATANRAGILLALVPVFVGNGVIMTPDTFLAPCWAGTVCLVWMALRGAPRRAPLVWGAAGVCAGLGLLSKYSMVLVFPGLALYWLAVPADRRKVFWGTALCGGVALLVFSPVLVWNARHEWVSFGFQLHHGLSEGRQADLARTLPGYVAGLLLVATPLLAALVVWRGMRGPWRSEPRRTFLASIFWAVIGVFAYSALKTDVQANWAMMAFLTGVILVAGDWPVCPPGWRRLAVALLVSVTVAGMAYLLLPVQYALKVGTRSLDAARMREFIVTPALAEAVRKAQRETGAGVICPATHQLLGVISFYAPELRDRLVLTGKGGRRFPWRAPHLGGGETALLVSTGKGIDWKSQGGFSEVRDLEPVDLPYKGDRKLTLYLALGKDFDPGAVQGAVARGAAP